MGDRRGIFITFEGGEGSGKSTHIRFLAEALEAAGRETVVLREPGGTETGEKLRAIVLDPANSVLSDEAELLIYEAARAQIVAERIRPALERGAVVLCDRFTDSTIAYQAYGRGLPRSFVEAANAFACAGLVPDRTILMVTGGAVEEGLRRATKDDGADRLELAGTGFHERVNRAFADLAACDPERIRVCSSRESKDRTRIAVFQALADLLPELLEEIPAADAAAAADMPGTAGAPGASDTADTAEAASSCASRTVGRNVPAGREAR